MTDDPNNGEISVSRRAVLRGACRGGTLLGIVSLTAPATAATKMPQTTVSYQPTPRGPAHCGTCRFFQAPSSCSYVDGAITPSGWCVLYRARDQSAG
jgi:hypothetical protein